MLREFMVPLFTLCGIVIAGIASLDKLCQFNELYQSMSAKLESERWLLDQCSDPHFFSKMHLHTDLCFQVENNARVGAFLLALRELTQSFLFQQLVSTLVTSHQGLLSWPVLAVCGFLILFGPSWLVSSSRSLHRARGWPECNDGHFKNS
jgi:hypothetical protein